MTTLGEKIRKARRDQKLTLRQVADKSGISNPLISQIENGVIIMPGFRTVTKIARALAISLDDLADCD